MVVWGRCLGHSRNDISPHNAATNDLGNKAWQVLNNQSNVRERSASQSEVDIRTFAAAGFCGMTDEESSCFLPAMSTHGHFHPTHTTHRALSVEHITHLLVNMG